MAANNTKLTIEDVKLKLKQMNSDVIIVDDVYKGNKHKLKCKCLICDEYFEKSWNDFTRGRGCPACGKNGVKITKNEISEFISKSGYEIVSFNGIDSNKGTLFTVKCSDGHIYETNYREFNREEHTRGGSCKTCTQLNIGSARRNDTQLVLNNIEQWGYSIEEDFNYKNSVEHHKFICKNGHVRKISYDSLRYRPDCPQCHRKNRLSEKQVTEKLKSVGLEYISGYEGIYEKLQYKCSCGKVTTGVLKQLMKGLKCNTCNKKKRYNLDELKEICLKRNCTLLSTSVPRTIDKIEYLCHKCEKVQNVTLNSFLSGTGCNSCAIKRRSGENHSSWNPNLTDAERAKNRKTPEYKHWRNFIYKRDKYTCQCCGDSNGGNLEAHHLDSHDWAKDKRLDVNNGITLCNICHTDFHNLYGYGNNTKEQFEEYMLELYSYI